MSATHAWLQDFSWAVVTAQNAVLCQAKRALHKLPLLPDKAFVVRSLALHIVAGAATDEDVTAFCEFCDALDHGR